MRPPSARVAPGPHDLKELAGSEVVPAAAGTMDHGFPNRPKHAAHPQVGVEHRSVGVPPLVLVVEVHSQLRPSAPVDHVGGVVGETTLTTVVEVEATEPERVLGVFVERPYRLDTDVSGRMGTTSRRRSALRTSSGRDGCARLERPAVAWGFGPGHIVTSSPWRVPTTRMILVRLSCRLRRRRTRRRRCRYPDAVEDARHGYWWLERGLESMFRRQ